MNENRMNDNEGTNRSIVIGLIVLIAVIVIAVLAYPALTGNDDDNGNDVANTVDQAGDAISNGAAGVATQASDTAGDVADSAQGAATDVAGGAQAAATDVAGAVGDTTDQTGDTGAVGQAGGVVADLQVGELVATTDVGDDNCAVDQATTDTFTADQPMYIVASGANVPQATSLYVRILQNDTPVTQTQPISVAQGAQDSCLAFLVTPEGGTPLAAGQYTAQLMANDTEVSSVDFTVQDATGSAG